jgi:predicted transcriptional regulator
MTPSRELQQIDQGQLGLANIAKNNSRFRNRNRMALIANILRVAEKGVVLTHLMYKANLSHRMLSVYVPFLLQQGLLEEAPSESSRSSIYTTTKLGTECLKAYNSLLDLAGGLKRFTPFADGFLEGE